MLIEKVIVIFNYN